MELQRYLGTLGGLGIGLIVENYSGFTLGDQRTYVSAGTQDTQYVHTVGPRILRVTFIGLVLWLELGLAIERSSSSITAAINAGTPLDSYPGRLELLHFNQLFKLLDSP